MSIDETKSNSLRQGTSHELSRFLVVGSLTVLVDFVVYLGASVFVVVLVAKALGFLVGSAFAYWANQRFTFPKTESNRLRLFRFAGVYLIALLVNTFSNLMLLTILGRSYILVVVSFGLATLLSATLNFLGMKLFVFTAQKVR